MRRYTFVFQVFLFLGLCVALPGFVIWQANKPKPLSPRVQQIKELFDRIVTDLTEEEVDAVLPGYVGNAWREEREEIYWPSKLLAQPLVRKSYRTKHYTEKGVREGDHFIAVFFDEQGRVVGKEVGEYCW